MFPFNPPLGLSLSKSRAMISTPRIVSRISIPILAKLSPLSDSHAGSGYQGLGPLDRSLGMVAFGKRLAKPVVFKPGYDEQARLRAIPENFGFHGELVF